MKTVLFATAAAFCSLSTAAYAQSAPVAIASVGELVVTANRSPQEIERIGQSITVLTAEEIKASQII
ncbi:hypothetical protein ABTK59_19940, partial [Acinetobacter baumannii]